MATRGTLGPCEECGWVGYREDATEWEGIIACPWCATIFTKNAESFDLNQTNEGRLGEDMRGESR